MLRPLIGTACLTLTLALSASAFAGDFSDASLKGRRIFETRSAGTTAELAIWEPDGSGSATHPQLHELKFRTVLEFDGLGGFTGFRLVHGYSMETPHEPGPLPSYTDHRLTPLRQELTGSYSVTADGVVAMTYTVTPPRFFSTHFWSHQSVGQGVRAMESAQGVLGSDGRLLGQFQMTLDRRPPPSMGRPDHHVVMVFEFETLEAAPCETTTDPEPPSRRLQRR